MLKNHFKNALRNMARSKAISFINIGGLAIGMAVVMLIGLWIWDELSFDKYHQNYDHIAQVRQFETYDGSVHTDKALPIPLAVELRHTYGDDFKYVILSSWTNPHILSFTDKNLSVPGNFMEPDAPGMLTLKMLKGAWSGLKDPFSVLLSRSVSKSIFGDADPIGKMVQIDHKLNVKVTGVYEDLPYNTSLSNLSFIAPWDLYTSSQGGVKEDISNWGANGSQIFVQVADNRDMARVSARIKNAKRNHIDKEGAQKYKPEVFLQPMSRWHLFSEFKNGVNIGGGIQYIWLFGIIGCFVLLLACINFMNLSTARSEKRAKEVGIRKAVGSLRSQLIGQFFTESLLFSVIAFFFSLVLVQLALPFFNEMVNKKIHILWANPLFWLPGFCFCIITGLIAGSYPAFYLSSFQPVKVLKGNFRVGRLASLPRKVLVVVQFTISVTMIIGTICVYRQIQFARNRPIGYDRNGLVMIRTYTDDLHVHFDAVRTDLLKAGVITEIAESGNTITKGARTCGGCFEWKGKDPNMNDDFMTFGVTPEYGKTVSWQFIAGRDFSKTFSMDSSGLILNEAAVKNMGLKDPVGQAIGWNNKTYTILGVVKDMVMESPYEPVMQTVFYISSGQALNLRINPRVSTAEALHKIEIVCKRYSPATPFDYLFADEEYAKKFGNEERIGKLASLFATLAIFISCLGLSGMASFMAEQRIKEIGVRKVLGASVFNLWRLLSKGFVVLIIISFVIATPLAYFFMHNWLQNYSYRAAISWWVYVAAGLGALLITLLTISYQSIRAALMNPAKSLRSE